MLRNAVTGSSKNMTPNWLIATSKGPPSFVPTLVLLIDGEGVDSRKRARGPVKKRERGLAAAIGFPRPGDVAPLGALLRFARSVSALAGGRHQCGVRHFLYGGRS